jgi:threonine/homoserine/homoserine lactone efflux protein
LAQALVMVVLRPGPEIGKPFQQTQDRPPRPAPGRTGGDVKGGHAVMLSAACWWQHPPKTYGRSLQRAIQAARGKRKQVGGQRVIGFLAYLLAATVGLTAVPGARRPSRDIHGREVAGAGYLAFLAWQTLRPGGAAPFETNDLTGHSARRLFGMGPLTNLLNPKIALMYMALIPQFVAPDRGPVWAQALVLGSVQIAVALVVNALIVLGVAGIAGFLSPRPAWARIQRCATGTLLGAFAVKMAVSRLPATA